MKRYFQHEQDVQREYEFVQQRRKKLRAFYKSSKECKGIYSQIFDLSEKDICNFD